MSNLAQAIMWKFNNIQGWVIDDAILIKFPKNVPDVQYENDLPTQGNQDIWQAEYEAQLPTMEWKEKMVVSDGPLPRWAEDLVDGTISSQTQKLSDDKKALRATKP